MIHRNVGRVSNLVLDLLNYSKERELQYQPCSPNHIAEEICQLMESKAKEYHDERKKWWVKVKTALNGDTITFDVSDNGCGMNEEVKGKLFTSFFSTKGGKGTGLGLLVT